MTLREQVVKAFETGDELAIHRLGWPPVREALATWWALPREWTMIAYAKLLGGEDPAKILEALEALAVDKWRPAPPVIRGHLHRPDDESTVHAGRGRDVYLNDEAVRAVAEALRAGEQGCTCGGWQPSRFPPDAAGVQRCRDCHGLEDGQVYAAEDAGLLDDDVVVGDAEPVADAPLLLTPGGTHG